LDPCSDRYRRHTRHLELASCFVNIKHSEDLSGSAATKRDFLPRTVRTTCHPVD
jgi:hypothetical protein